MWFIIFKFSFAGAFLCLDRVACGQFMFSRPIVAGTIIGWLNGNSPLGLLTGSLLELLWLHELPVGCAIPTDDTIIAILGSGIITTIASRQHLQNPAQIGSLIFIILSILFCLAPLSRKIDILIRNRNAELLIDMETKLLYGKPKEAIKIHLKGLFNFWSYNFLTIFTVSFVLVLLIPALHNLLPHYLHLWLTQCLVIFPLWGIAAVLNGLNKKYALVIFIVLVFICKIT